MQGHAVANAVQGRRHRKKAEYKEGVELPEEEEEEKGTHGSSRGSNSMMGRNFDTHFNLGFSLTLAWRTVFNAASILEVIQRNLVCVRIARLRGQKTKSKWQTAHAFPKNGLCGI